MTSPIPVMISEDSRSATASIASRRRSIRSVRQSLASSTAERSRFPWCLSSFASKRSNSVNASAVPPAKPARIRSLYRRRTLRALAFTTTLPRVTWPSPPSATLPSRRADMMVVPWNCSMSEFREDGAGLPSIKLFARNNAGDPAQPRDPEQGTDELVRAANLNRGAGLLELREHVQHEAGCDKINARRLRHVDDQHLVRYGPVLQLFGEGFTRPAQLPGENQGLVRGLNRLEDRGTLGLRSRLRLPGRRRNLEGDRIVDRRFLELVLEVENPVHIEQQRPRGTVGFGPSGLAGPLQKLDEPRLSGEPHFLSRVAKGKQRFAEQPAARAVDAAQFAAIHAPRLKAQPAPARPLRSRIGSPSLR